MKNYVTIKATIVTALLIILLIGCITIMYIKKDNPELNSFLLAMSIGLFFCVIKCYFNIQRKLKLIEERAAELRRKNGHENHVKFETCPEYWTRKKIVTEDGNEAVMCYNYFKNTNDEKILVGGEYNMHTDTIDNNSVKNYKFDDQINLSSLYSYTARSNQLMNNDIHSDSCEHFTATPVMHKHNYDVNLKSNVDTDEIEAHHHKYDGTAWHMHPPGQELAFSFSDVYDIYTPQNSNLHYWLNNYTDDTNTNYAEINLTKLNEIANNCDLVNELSWIEKQRCNKFDIE